MSLCQISFTVSTVLYGRSGQQPLEVKIEFSGVNTTQKPSFTYPRLPYILLWSLLEVGRSKGSLVATEASKRTPSEWEMNTVQLISLPELSSLNTDFRRN